MNRERYLRQMQIPGWNQARLAAAHVLIVGSNALAATVAAGAAALGVGALTLLDDAVIEQSGGFLAADAPAGTRRVRALEAGLRTLNPEVKVQSIAARLRSETQLLSLSPLHAIIVASGRADDAAICAAYATQRPLPLIVAHATEQQGWCALGQRSTARALTALTAEQSAPGLAVSCVIAGLALSELRAWLMPFLPNDLAAEQLISYAAAAPQRFAVERGAQSSAGSGATRGEEHGVQALAWGLGLLENDGPKLKLELHALTSNAQQPAVPAPSSLGELVLAGAGGLGTWFALALAAEALVERLTIFDPDVIAAHNLNRQILYAEAVGEPKAETLARQLCLLNPRLQPTAINTRLAPDYIAAHRAEIAGVVAAVDNFAARAALQEVCGQHQLPLINGGSGALQADVAVYAPGYSACLNCVMNLQRLAEQESRDPASCGAAPEASTVIANMIAGGLMAAEARNLLTAPATVPRASLAYDAWSLTRVGLRSIRPPCQCWQANRN